MYVISSKNNVTHIVGINNARAVTRTKGPAIFAFYDVLVADRFASVVDDVIERTGRVVAEDIVVPSMHLKMGKQIVVPDVEKPKELIHVDIVEIDDINGIVNSVKGLRGSIVVINEKHSKLFVKKILFPGKFDDDLAKMFLEYNLTC